MVLWATKKYCCKIEGSAHAPDVKNWTYFPSGDWLLPHWHAVVGRISWSIMIFSIQNMKCCRWIVCSYVIWRQNSVFYVRGIKLLDSLDVVVKTKELDALKLVSFCVFSFWYLLCSQLNDSSKSHIDFLVKVTLMNVLMLSHYKFWHKVFWKI